MNLERKEIYSRIGSSSRIELSDIELATITASVEIEEHVAVKDEILKHKTGPDRIGLLDPSIIPETLVELPLRSLLLASVVAAGIQFGWALQLSLLTPYIQTLGIGHEFSSFIWLCGPITGLVAQPCIGIWSDQCNSKWGRRRPFIFAGALLVIVATNMIADIYFVLDNNVRDMLKLPQWMACWCAQDFDYVGITILDVTIIGFSADIGYLLGDSHVNCLEYKGVRPRAAGVFVLGFWVLDLANNTVQGPARALLADITGPGQRDVANAIFSLWMAVGNVFGFTTGAIGKWHAWFPFLTSKACCEACGNLKAAFLVAVIMTEFSHHPQNSDRNSGRRFHLME